jgi:hypothetical protein
MAVTPPSIKGGRRRLDEGGVSRLQYGLHNGLNEAEPSHAGFSHQPAGRQQVLLRVQNEPIKKGDLSSNLPEMKRSPFVNVAVKRVYYQRLIHVGTLLQLDDLRI